jgi:hypothetical protein
MKDWLKANCTASFLPEDVETYMTSTAVLSACRDICNANKHYTINRYNPSTGDVYVSASAVTVTAMSLPASGVGLESDEKPTFRVKVLLKDGAKYEVTEFARRVLDAWAHYFTSKGI